MPGNGCPRKNADGHERVTGVPRSLRDCIKSPAGGEMGAFATIAQHFSAGASGKMRAKVPQGRKTCLGARDSAVPAGLDSSPHPYPSTEVLGYFSPTADFLHSLSGILRAYFLLSHFPGILSRSGGRRGSAWAEGGGSGAALFFREARTGSCFGGSDSS